MTTDHPDIREFCREITATLEAAEARYLAQAADGAEWLARYGDLRRELARAKGENR